MLYRLLVVVLSFALAGCGGGGGNGGSNIGVGAKVPNVVGLTQASATTAITNAGLKLGKVTQQTNSMVQAGNVISQNPAAGTVAAPNSAVNLVVASGAPLVDLVPAFPNLPAFNAPLFLAPVPGDARLVVVEQPGKVKVFGASDSSTTAILDVAPLITTGGDEQGLLGLAFDPNFTSNHFLYVFYTCLGNGTTCPSNGALTIARYTWNPATVAAGASKIILTIPHTSAPNHNGGMLAFGADGFLYIGTGDGGGDPTLTGQNVNSLLAKILRIDVHPANDATPYLVPGDNPLFGGVRSEIWAMGFRNPFRFSFDRQNGTTLWVGDVGQNQFEEIDVVTKGGNYGWPRFEGSHDYDVSVALAAGTVHAPPIAEYDHSVGFAIIGGYVYRGTRFPALAGRYVYGDLSGPVWAIPGNGSQQGDVTQNEPITNDGTITSFGQDNAGELYVIDRGGQVFKFQNP